jgi:inosine-uridine nucleoside N-ribohydrolase
MRRRIIIDTDAGIDDAQALALALSRPPGELQILAICAVHGNVALADVQGIHFYAL